MKIAYMRICAGMSNILSMLKKPLLVWCNLRLITVEITRIIGIAIRANFHHMLNTESFILNVTSEKKRNTGKKYATFSNVSNIDRQL
jgi:hypothetical protein